MCNIAESNYSTIYFTIDQILIIIFTIDQAIRY